MSERCEPVQLICFPHAGAGASRFHGWHALAPAGLEVVPVPLPGREGRYAEKAPLDLHAVLQDSIEQLDDALSRPYALLGHSMGAMLAFELARLLRARERRAPERLFVSAFRAPHMPDGKAALHALPDTLLKAELSRLAGTPTEVLEQPELMQTLLPTLRSDLALVEGYRYRSEPPLGCPITCLAGIDDAHVSRPELRAWRHHTVGEYRLRLFPGRHFYLFGMPTLVLRAACADLGVAAPNEPPDRLAVTGGIR